MAVKLPDEWTTAINGALEANRPPVWSSVEADGQPSLAFYGSTHVHSDHQLSLWMRSTARGFLRRIEVNPKVAMFYSNRTPEARLTLLIHGEARRIDDPVRARQIYDQTPELERNADPNAEGVAVLVEIVRVLQRGQVVMSRDGDDGAESD